MDRINIGFIGAGGIARAHAFALNALKFYYDDAPCIDLRAVSSMRKESRERFAKKYDFKEAMDVESFVKHPGINTVYILGPNKVHFPHLEAVLKMDNVERIYLEKPICSTREEELKLEQLAQSISKKVKIRVGFQLLASSAIRKALNLWHSGRFGKPVHFRFNYMHSDYQDINYRKKRYTRLTPAPDGGAMADLGSHAISLMIAFLGHDLEIVNAMQGGAFADVPDESDLYSEISLFEKSSGAVGNLSASRISAGMGDVFIFEIFAENGSLRYNSYYPDRFEYYNNADNNWVEIYSGSDYKPFSTFPSGHVPGGWLRSLFHAHYSFLSEGETGEAIADLNHGLEVQRLVRETAIHLHKFREKRSKGIT